jgi:hypothetical protein
MFRRLLLAAIVTASFGASILGSATPASAFLRFDFAMVSVGTADMDEDNDDDFGWLSP